MKSRLTIEQFIAVIVKTTTIWRPPSLFDCVSILSPDTYFLVLVVDFNGNIFNYGFLA